jgi:hypothetical protein
MWGIRESRCLKDLGIAGIVAGVLACRGAAWAFAAGLIVCFLVYGAKIFHEKHPEEPVIWKDQREDGSTIDKHEEEKELDATVQTPAFCASPALREAMEEAGKGQPS